MLCPFQLGGKKKKKLWSRFLLTHDLLQLVINNSSLLKSRLLSFSMDKQNHTIHLKRGLWITTQKQLRAGLIWLLWDRFQLKGRGKETRVHYIPLVGWCCSTTFTGKNHNKKTRLCELIFNFSEKVGKTEPRVTKQLVPRAKEQVTGSRWMQLVVAKRATPLRWR